MTNKELREEIEQVIEDLSKIKKANEKNEIKDGDIDAALVIAYRNRLEVAISKIDNN